MIELQQFLKLVLNVSGGEAKHIIQDGYVKVNGEVETRRSRKLSPEDKVEINGHIYLVAEYLSSR